MGRPPIGKTAMSDAERQRKCRAKLASDMAMEWSPAYQPEWGRDMVRHNRFLDGLHMWLELGDIEQVTEFIASIGRWHKLAPLVAAKAEELERAAIAEDKHRQAWLRDHPGEDPLDYVPIS